VLGIHERRVTQSLDPTLRRIALLWIADPTKTIRAILDMVERTEEAVRAEQAEMTPEEHDVRARFNMGRVDLCEVLPPRE
jgi:prephenate dehydrogenase